MFRSRTSAGRRRLTMVSLALVAALTVVAVPAAPSGAAFTVNAGVTRNVIRFGMGTTVVGSTSLMAAGTRVTVERRLNATTWSTRAAGTVRSDGTFSIPITPTSVGIYALRVRTTVGLSAVFHLRVLGPLRLDPGGLQTLRLGMTVAQAQASHWVQGTAPGCPLDVGAVAATFPPGIKASGEFSDGKLRWVAVNYGGSTVEGAKVGALRTTLATVFPAPTWTVTSDASSVDMYGVLLVSVSKAGKSVYGVTVDPATNKISQISTPFTAICD